MQMRIVFLQSAAGLGNEAGWAKLFFFLERPNFLNWVLKLKGVERRSGVGGVGREASGGFV